MIDSSLDAYIRKNFRLSLDTVEKGVQRAFYKAAKTKVDTWKKKLYKNLSKKVSKGIILGHKQRPDNPFPHYNSGDLRSSIRGDVKKNYTNKNFTLSIVVSVGYAGTSLAYPYSQFTNYSKPRRKDGSIAQWYGWLGDAFTGSTGGRMESISSVIDNLISMRLDIKNLGA